MASFSNSKLVSPEPYYINEYYNNILSIAEAFNEEINGEQNPLVSIKPNLYLHPNESKTSKFMMDEAKKKFKKDKFIVFQPYGSGINKSNDEWVDNSNRSLDINKTNYIASELSKHAVVLYFGPNELIQPNTENFLLNAK